jgi:methionyl aminopeptidase
MRRNDDELAKMRKAGKVVAEMHEATRAAAKPGVTTAELDAGGPPGAGARGATSNFLNYHGFPGGHLHLAQLHDRPRHPRRLRLRGGGHHLGRLRGHHRGLPRRRRLHHGHGRGLGRGPEADGGHRAQPVGRDRPADPGNRLHEVGRAVQEVAEAAGFSVVREYVGHAIGTAMHESPRCPTTGPGRGPTLKTGHGLRRRAHGQRRVRRRPSCSTTAGAW